MSSFEEFGACSNCGMPLEPVYFEEEEFNWISPTPVKTGRKRTAVDYLLCPYCGQTEIVDDSFDGPWHY